MVRFRTTYRHGPRRSFFHRNIHEDRRRGAGWSWRFVMWTIACVLYAACFFIAEQVLVFLGDSEMRRYEDGLKRIPLWNSYVLREEVSDCGTMCLWREDGRTNTNEGREDGRKSTVVVVSGIKLIGMDTHIIWGLRRRDSLLSPLAHNESPVEYFFLREGDDVVTLCQTQDDCLRRAGQDRYGPLLDVDAAWKTYWQHHGRCQGVGWLFRRSIARKRPADLVFDILLTVVVFSVACLRVFRPFGGGVLQLVKVAAFFIAFMGASLLLVSISIAGMLLSVLCTVAYACLAPRKNLDATGSLRNVVASLIGGASLAILVLGWVHYFMWSSFSCSPWS